MQICLNRNHMGPYMAISNEAWKRSRLINLCESQPKYIRVGFLSCIANLRLGDIGGLWTGEVENVHDNISREECTQVKE